MEWRRRKARKLQEKHPASSQRGKKRAGNTCIFDFLLGFSVYLMAAIRTRRQSWRFGLDLPSRVRGSPFSFLAEERRGGKVHMPYSCTFRLLRTFWSWTPPGNRDYLPEQFFFSDSSKNFFRRELDRYHGNLFLLPRKIEIKRQARFRSNFIRTNGIIVRINFHFIFYDNSIIHDEICILVLSTTLIYSN